MEITATRADGVEFPVELTITRIRGVEPPMFTGYIRDISERLRAERNTAAQHAVASVLADAHQALHDELTGLPNRGLLFDRLGHALARSTRFGSTVAVLFMDIDDFKLINDGLGHHIGDRLLVALSERLSRVLRTATRSAARATPSPASAATSSWCCARTSAGRTTRCGSPSGSPRSCGGRPWWTGTSCRYGRASGSRWRRPAKRRRRRWSATPTPRCTAPRSRAAGAACCSTQAMHARVMQRLDVERDLRRAVAGGELRLHYQPIVSVTDGALCGFEALARWAAPRARARAARRVHPARRGHRADRPARRGG